MKFKLDENFGTRTQQVLRDAGHQVFTVRDQGLQGGTDQRLFEVICSEDCCLVTLDLDFTDVTRFPPNKADGIVVSRVPQNPTLALLERMIRQFLAMLNEHPINNGLWIVEVDRIRIHQSDT